MKLVWKDQQGRGGAKELHLIEDDRFSYVALLRQYDSIWRVHLVEFDDHPAAEALEAGRWDTRLKAMRAARTALTIMWIGATDEDKETLWDGYV